MSREGLEEREEESRRREGLEQREGEEQGTGVAGEEKKTRTVAEGREREEEKA